MDIFECGDQWLDEWDRQFGTDSASSTGLPACGDGDSSGNIIPSHQDTGIKNDQQQQLHAQLQATAVQNSEWLFYLDNSRIDSSTFAEYFPDMNIEPLDFDLSELLPPSSPICEGNIQVVQQRIQQSQNPAVVDQTEQVEHTQSLPDQTLVANAQGLQLSNLAQSQLRSKSPIYQSPLQAQSHSESESQQINPSLTTGDDHFLSKLFEVELISDKSSSDCSSEFDEIPTPLLDKDGKIIGNIGSVGMSFGVLENNRVVSPVSSTPSVLLDTMKCCRNIFNSNNPAVGGSIYIPEGIVFPPIQMDTFEQLLASTNIVNRSRGFNNIKEHRWLPYNHNFDSKLLVDYNPIWARPNESKYPSLFVAVLRQGNRVSNINNIGDLESVEAPQAGGGDGLLTGSGQKIRAQKGHGKTKKKRPSLKAWDPIEVKYPIGYIPFTLWFHMRDLRPEQKYNFDTEAFKSPPYPWPDGITEARQDEMDMANNKYDSFYHRSGGPDASDRECYCGCCKSWHKRDQCNWLHHMKSAHGIRSCTKQRYPLPHIMSERPDKKEGSGMFIGFCDQCQSWQNVNNSTGPSNSYASWFLHQASHDVQRNRLEGRTGKKRSKKDMKDLQRIIGSNENRDRQKTKYAIAQLMAEDLEFNGDQNQFTGPYFARPENYTFTIESQDIDGGSLKRSM